MTRRPFCACALNEPKIATVNSCCASVSNNGMYPNFSFKIDMPSIKTYFKIFSSLWCDASLKKIYITGWLGSTKVASFHSQMVQSQTTACYSYSHHYAKNLPSVLCVRCQKTSLQTPLPSLHCDTNGIKHFPTVFRIRSLYQFFLKHGDQDLAGHFKAKLQTRHNF